MKESYHYLLMANHLMIQKKLLAVIKDTDLTLGQPKILDYLKEHDGATQKEIAKGCFIEPASLTSILNGMEKKALVTRNVMNGNRRMHHIFLTDKGKEMLKIVEGAFVQIEESIFAGISQDEKQVFMEVFERLYNNIKTKEEID